MGSILATLFEHELLTFLIVFAAVPYIYLSLAADVQKDCAEVIRNNLKEDNSHRISKYIEEISFIFNAEWWLIAAAAVLLIFLFNVGTFLGNSAFFCGDASPSIFTVTCLATGKEVAGMRRLFMMYTLLIGLGLAFRVWWARVAIAKQIRELYADLGDGGKKLLAWDDKAQ